jgi:phospholipase A1
MLPIGLWGLALPPTIGLAQLPTDLEQCLLEALEDASDETTIGDLRRLCAPQADEVREVTEAPEGDAATVLAERRQAEHAARVSPFLITAHRPNYALLATYNPDPYSQPFQEAFPNEDNTLSNVEAMFQLSLKVPIVTDIFWGHGNLFFAYTQRSFWQVYDTVLSSPFRENDFEPEAFLSFNTDWGLGGWKNSLMTVGVNHQSNGRSAPLSRSWNRIFARFDFDNPKYNLYFSLKPWLIIGDVSDNPDIEKFMGHGELLGVYRWKEQSFGLMVRNNLRSDPNRGAYQLDWSFPLYKRWRAYIQYFNGYGYSLIDYNDNQNVIGIGVQISDYF